MIGGFIKLLIILVIIYLIVGVGVQAWNNMMNDDPVTKITWKDTWQWPKNVFGK
ncbi:MAG: hypothetical protein R3267_04310 [Paenisporosarcina sp.]|nr:hypothetical protein [Paenisporosarcina sp.]